nr:hypothetical protein [Kineosporia rhizophila]
MFVCVRNGGKSQMAAALLRQHAGPGIYVDSAGTDPGTKLNAQSIQALAEVGADMSGGAPKALTEDMIATADLVVILGSEAHVEPVAGTPVITWETDEPSLRGIEGMERMRLIRDDITTRVLGLAHHFGALATTPEPVTGVDVSAIADELLYRFDGVFTKDEISEAVQQARAALQPQARVTIFLPVLITRYARELLTAAAQADGRVAKTVPEILFVCVHNAGRSQMAAAIAAHLAPGRIHVRSAGSQPTGDLNQVAVQALHERGIDLSTAYPKPLSDSVIHAADVIVTMGCDDACPVYPGKRYEEWDITDPAGQPLDSIRDIRDDITTRVSTLLRELGI